MKNQACVKTNLFVWISYEMTDSKEKKGHSTKKLDGTKWYTVHMQRSFRKSNNTFPNLLPGGRKLSLEFRQNSSHYVTNRRLSNFLCQS